jgi:guanylate kinase
MDDGARMVSHAAPLVVIIGPSGSGKSSAVRALSDRGILRVHPTWTTRPRRPDEAEGSVEHRFVSEAEFDRLAAGGLFLDTIALFGLPHRYGLPSIERSIDGRMDAVMLRAPLVERFQQFVSDIFVLQIEDTPERIMARLRERGGSNHDLQARLRDNEREIRAGRTLADGVVRNDATLDELVDRVAAHIFAVRHRRWQGQATRRRPTSGPGSGRAQRVWISLGIVAASGFLLVGLAYVAFFLLVTAFFSGFGSNK